MYILFCVKTCTTLIILHNFLYILCLDSVWSKKNFIVLPPFIFHMRLRLWLKDQGKKTADHHSLLPLLIKAVIKPVWTHPAPNHARLHGNVRSGCCMRDVSFR
jgi:hypothetical protein